MEFTVTNSNLSKIDLANLINRILMLCQDREDLNTLIGLVQHAIQGLPSEFVQTQIPNHFYEKVEAMWDALPDRSAEDKQRVHDYLDRLNLEIKEACRTFFEESFETYENEIYRGFNDFETMSPEDKAMLFIKVVVLTTSKICMGDRDVEDTLNRGLQLVEAFIGEGEEEGVSYRKKQNFLSEDLRKYKITQTIHTGLVNFQETLLKGLKENPNNFRFYVVSCKYYFEEILEFYQEIMTVN